MLCGATETKRSYGYSSQSIVTWRRYSLNSSSNKGDTSEVGCVEDEAGIGDGMRRRVDEDND